MSSNCPAEGERYSPIISLSKLVMAMPGSAGIFEVADIDAHAGAGFAFGAESQASFHGDVFEFSVAQIAVKFVGLGVVGDEADPASRPDRNRAWRHPAILNWCRRFRWWRLRLRTCHCRDCGKASRYLRDRLRECNRIYFFRPGCKRRRVPATSSHNCRRRDRDGRRDHNRTTARKC